LEYFNIYFKN